MNTAFSFLQAAFVLLTIVYFSFLVRELYKGIALSTIPQERKKKLLRQIVVGLIVWTVFVSAWSLSGIMADFSRFPFNAAPVLVVPVVVILVVTFSGTTAEILRHIPVEHLFYLQGFRVFVELLLWGLFAVEALPVQMTFEGRNFDILVGLSGPVVGYLAARKMLGRTALILWNVAGLALLANIVTVAILSMPTPFRVFTNEPANTIVTHFPVSWLPGLLVPLAYTLHFLSIRQLLYKKA